MSDMLYPFRHTGYKIINANGGYRFHKNIIVAEFQQIHEIRTYKPSASADKKAAPFYNFQRSSDFQIYIPYILLYNFIYTQLSSPLHRILIMVFPEPFYRPVNSFLKAHPWLPVQPGSDPCQIRLRAP